METIKILVIHGPNLNLLGTREPEIYGSTTYEDINKIIKEYAENNKIEVEIFQSNSEGDIVNYIQKKKDYNGLVINPAAYTHTSIAIGDAIKAVNIPAVEVHLSNIHSREDFRRTSYIAPVCIGQISGFGHYSYILGINALVNHLK
jgi:3-dehydroquinate dehydratase II